MAALRLAIVGFGKIATGQHVPAIKASPDVEWVAIADPKATTAEVPHFTSLEALLRDGPAIDAVTLCTPPQARSAQARIALEAGKHVMLEKPPGATVSEITPLAAVAQAARKTLFATWHSRFAPAVEPARKALAGRKIHSVSIIWKEDVKVWHPGQAWIFEPGGFGVFDTGINALSILTHILERPVFVTRAELGFPSNRGAPIVVGMDMADSAGLPIKVEFDFRQTGLQTWDMRFETDKGPLLLSGGGSKLSDGDKGVIDAMKGEYPALYRRFVELATKGESDVDLAPLQITADAFMLGRHYTVEAFEE